jgi:cell wall-associated NlpC family hydrolase
MTVAPDDFLASLPTAFHDTAYVYERHPGAPGVEGVAEGANCQQYAYEVLRHFGYDMPPLRSSDLWEDRATTSVVETLDLAQPLDLILFSPTDEAYGAHVGLYLGDGPVLHLSYYVGRPVSWTLEQFAEHPKYRVLVGIKRPRRRSGAVA